MGIKKYLLVTSLILCGVSCRQRVAPEADLSQINGVVIRESIYPAVVWIGGCTATFVSHNTLLTAAHCIERQQPLGENGLLQATIRLPYNGGVSSQRVYMNPDFRRNNVPSLPGSPGRTYTQADFVIAVFPDNTAPATMAINSDQPQVGDDITLVGYGGDWWRGGPGNAQSGPAGTKRMGINKLTYAGEAYLGSVVGAANNEGNGVAVVPGDSGGPLFRKGKLSGITSTGSFGRGSQHSNIMNQTNLAFMQSVVAADSSVSIQGFNGVTDDHLKDVYVKLEGMNSDNTVQLQVSAMASAAKAAVCETKTYFECGPDARTYRELPGAQAFGDRVSFVDQGGIQPIANKTYSVVVWDQYGKVLGGNSFALSPRQ